MAVDNDLYEKFPISKADKISITPLILLGQARLSIQQAILGDHDQYPYPEWHFNDEPDDIRKSIRNNRRYRSPEDKLATTKEEEQAQKSQYIINLDSPYIPNPPEKTAREEYERQILKLELTSRWQQFIQSACHSVGLTSEFAVNTLSPDIARPIVDIAAQIHILHGQINAIPEWNYIRAELQMQTPADYQRNFRVIELLASIMGIRAHGHVSQADGLKWVQRERYKYLSGVMFHIDTTEAFYALLLSSKYLKG